MLSIYTEGERNALALWVAMIWKKVMVILPLFAAILWKMIMPLPSTSEMFKHARFVDGDKNCDDSDDCGD